LPTDGGLPASERSSSDVMGFTPMMACRREGRRWQPWGPPALGYL